MARTKKQSTEAAVREIRRKTRRKFAPEEKVRIVLEGLRGEQSISELCRREGIASNLYYRWSKDFLEAGKKQVLSEVIFDRQDDMIGSRRTVGVARGWLEIAAGSEPEPSPNRQSYSVILPSGSTEPLPSKFTSSLTTPR
jgi:transposase